MRKEGSKIRQTHTACDGGKEPTGDKVASQVLSMSHSLTRRAVSSTQRFLIASCSSQQHIYILHSLLPPHVPEALLVPSHLSGSTGLYQLVLATLS